VVNGKVCHAETNVWLIREFRAGWILECEPLPPVRVPGGRLRDPRLTVGALGSEPGLQRPGVMAWQGLHQMRCARYDSADWLLQRASQKTKITA